MVREEFIGRVILIGPEGVGKSRLGEILSIKLKKPYLDTNKNRIKAFKRFGFSSFKAILIYCLKGFWGLYNYVKPFEFLYLKEVLSSENDCIIKIGAGGVIFFNEEHKEEIKSTFKSLEHVFLILPSSDMHTSLEKLKRLNCHLAKIKPCVNSHFLNFPYRELASNIVYTENKNLFEVADEIVGLLKKA